jgi:nucleoside-diphosphate-sugar epimerase
VNRIHVEDLARVLVAAAERGREGAIYVAGDDRPERARVVADFCAALVGAPPPPSVDPAEAARAMGESDFAMTQGNKRIRNARIREELGVRSGIPPTGRDRRRWPKRIPSHRTRAEGGWVRSRFARTAGRSRRDQHITITMSSLTTT